MISVEVQPNFLKWFFLFNFIDQTRRDIVYLVSPSQNHGNKAKSVGENGDAFTVLEVHRPENSNFIEEILIEKIVDNHKTFLKQKNLEIDFMIENEKNSTSKIVNIYLNNYNCLSTEIENRLKLEINNDDIYTNSPLQRSEKNEKEIEKYRKLRSKNGDEYNNNKNEIYGTLDRNKNMTVENENISFSVSLPLFLISISFCSFLSYLYGKNISSK